MSKILKNAHFLGNKICESEFPFCFPRISQSSFFEEVRCLILASSQRKLRGHIEFLKFDITIKKIQIRLKFKRPILAKFSIKDHLVLVQLRTKFQLDKPKFA